MSFVVAVPEVLGTAATDLASLGSTISSASAAAAAPRTGVVAAAGDEVSAAIAAVVSAHGRRAVTAVGLPSSGARTRNTWWTGSRLLVLPPGPPAYAAPARQPGGLLVGVRICRM
ncbi:MAG: PE family protein [Mycobacterium sp.]